MRKNNMPVLVAFLMAMGIVLAQSSPGVLELVSVSSAGVQGNNDSGTFSFLTPSGARAPISADGRFVAFVSFADNLVAEDTNQVADVFVRDRLTGSTERVSVTAKEREGNDHSGITSERVGISDDGRFVAFDSEATNLARGDSNANAEVFVRDRVTGDTELISRGLDGEPATGNSPSISGDGRFVAFISSSQNLVAGHPEFDISDHAYVYDRQTQLFERVDVDSAGVLGSGGIINIAISRDGRHVAFDTFDDELATGPGDQGGVDVLVRDRVTGTTEGISTIGDTGAFEGHSFLSSIGSDGRFVGFSSGDPTFEGDTNGSVSDVFVFDRQARTVQLVSRSSTGEQANDFSEGAFVSADGTSVVFSSRASNLAANDTNNAYDVFRRDLVTATTERLAGDDGEVGSHAIGSGTTPDGLVVSLITRADLIPEDAGIVMDIYVVDSRPPADLAVSMTDSPDPVASRAALTYTITVQNLGPGSSGRVTLTDRLPAAAVLVSAVASQGTCSREGQGNRDGLLTCDLQPIAAFGSATVTIVVSPSSDDMVLTNVVTVRGNAPDPQPTNNMATETTTVPPK
jgi:uncharacterized repeat protein (TIGR01451 family)